MIRTQRLALLASCSLALAACTTVRHLTPHFGGHQAPPPSGEQAVSPPPAPPAAKPARKSRHKQKPAPASTAAAVVPLSAPAAKPPPANVWPQTYADLPPDPAMRFGVLPNGMRYVVMKNATPGGQASLRLRINAGSLNETDSQQGLAHLLEHMAFNGSTHVPRGEMVNILERHGLAFGADTNASTSWDETVYKLDLPKADDDTVDSSMMLLREVAGELKLDQDALDQEKGVVLSEERLRDTPGYRVLKTSLGYSLQGQLAADRFPIGQVDVVRNATHDQLEAFYRAYYRPERAVLVAVGDFDPDAMEAKIKARFGDWTDAAPPGPDPDLGTPLQRGAQARLNVQPGASELLQIGWVTPPDLSPDSVAKRRREVIETLGLAVLNRRLEKLVRADDPPFISAVAYRSDEFHSARLTMVQATPQPGQWTKALNATDQAVRQLLTYGVSQAELDEEIDSYRANLKASADGAATRTTPAIAEDIVGTLDTPEVETSPAEDLALFDATVKGLTAAEANATVTAAFRGSGPLVLLSTQSPIDGGEAALTQAFQSAEAAPVQPASAQAALNWPYEDFGAAGKVAERRDIADLDTVFVRFENGVRLTVKPTKFRDDQILVQVRVGDGQLSMPGNRPTAAWAASSAFPESGLDQLTAQDIDQVLRSRIVGRAFSVGEDAFALSGSTRGDDLDTQMQLLAAYVTHPGWRTAAFERMQKAAPTILDQLSATPAGVLNRDLGQLLHAGDRRWGIPSRAEIAAETPGDLKTLVGPALESGQIEVVVVGDTTVEKAIESVAATFGALPPRPAAPAPDLTPSVRFPAGSPTPIVLTHGGRADQAIGLMAWPTGDFLSDTQTARVLTLLSDVLQLRLTDQIRKAEGLTYSPSASFSPSQAFAGYGYLSARVEIPPARLDGFFKDVDAIVADLKAHDISADELDRAKTPAVDSLERRRQTNEYWLMALSDGQADPRRLAAIRTSEAQLQRVTADDIRRAAQTYLDSAKAWKLEVVPRAAAPAK
ncbi:MAG: insulinase family protein [Caulobacteraceae bacterium]|nr:insulinase family protein [Caulobacteraceae bacterium]